MLALVVISIIVAYMIVAGWMYLLCEEYRLCKKTDIGDVSAIASFAWPLCSFGIIATVISRKRKEAREQEAERQRKEEEMLKEAGIKV